jgi:hypothetical protein
MPDPNANPTSGGIEIRLRQKSPRKRELLRVGLETFGRFSSANSKTDSEMVSPSD